MSKNIIWLYEKGWLRLIYQIKTKQESVEVTNLFSKSWQNNVDGIANSSELNIFPFSPCKTHAYSVTDNRKVYLAFLCSFAWTWTNILGASTNIIGASSNVVLKLNLSKYFKLHYQSSFGIEFFGMFSIEFWKEKYAIAVKVFEQVGYNLLLWSISFDNVNKETKSKLKFSFGAWIKSGKQMFSQKTFWFLTILFKRT